MAKASVETFLSVIIQCGWCVTRNRAISCRPSERVSQDQMIRSYLRAGIVFENQIRLLDQMITNQERRTQESLRLQAYCQAALQRGEPPDEIAENMPSEFSYLLSHQKSARVLPNGIGVSMIPICVT